MKPKNTITFRLIHGLFGFGIVTEKVNIAKEKDILRCRLLIFKVFLGPFLTTINIYYNVKKQ